MSFSGKSALVTGSSRGIGRSIAVGLAERGARVAIHYQRDVEAAEEALAELGELVSPAAGPHVALQADVSDPDEARRLVSEAIRALGRIDILVNNAGIFEPHPMSRVSYHEWQEAWERTIGTNLLGPANVSYCVARHMVDRGGGRIVNISSRGAFRGEPDAPAYGASKAGLNALGQSLAQALGPHGVYVFTVAPGFVETDMACDVLAGEEGDAIRAQSPLNRVAQPDEVARAVIYLASEGAEFATGCILDVNGASYLRS